MIHATSMLDLAVLRAVLPRGRRDLGMVLSMHENQVAYPSDAASSGRDRDRDGHLAFVNLASIEAADRVVWNSGWNRDSFIEGMVAMLRHAPERVDRGWVSRLEARSTVVPPPIEMAEIEAAAGERSPVAEAGKILHNNGRVGYPEPGGRVQGVIRVVWPHRWEHDKGPDELLGLADEAWAREQTGGPAIRWWLLGHRFERVPESLEAMLDRHAARIEHAGPLPREAYLAALSRADWVLSTARHEFFGMAVAEALVAGCLPWLPRRLSYPELVPADAFDWNPWTRPEARRCPVDADQTIEARSATAGLRVGIKAMLEPAEASRAVASLEAVLGELV